VSNLYLAGVGSMMKERASFIPDMLEAGLYFFERPISYDPVRVERKWKPESGALMLELANEFSAVDFTAVKLEDTFKTYLGANNLGMGAVLPNLRLLLTGQGMGPGIFHIMELLGKEESLSRLQIGILELSK